MMVQHRMVTWVSESVPFQIALIFQLEYIDLPLSNSVAVLIFVATMSKNNFNFQYVIGRGGFGKVSQHFSP